MAQQQLFDPAKLNYRQFTPAVGSVEGAAGYNQQAGLPAYKPLPAGQPLQVNPERGLGLYHAYRDAEQAPESPTLKASYAAMGEDVRSQYDYATRPKEQGGMGLRMEVQKHDPYAQAWSGGNDAQALDAMGKDINQRGRLQVMSTASTGGHAYFDDDTNDKFRFVHDLFGHQSTGRGVSRSGEEAAWSSHRQMFRPEAHEALTSETRGQNSYLNYGQHGFPDQTEKLIGLPSWASQPGGMPQRPPSRVVGRLGIQRRLFNG